MCVLQVQLMLVSGVKEGIYLVAKIFLLRLFK